jgi:hypothetical protein
MSKWAPANKSNIASCMHVRIVDDGGEICIVTWQGREQTTDLLAEKICELANKEGSEK